jgi:hypothetical protein
LRLAAQYRQGILTPPELGVEATQDWVVTGEARWLKVWPRESSRHRQ